MASANAIADVFSTRRPPAPRTSRRACVHLGPVSGITSATRTPRRQRPRTAQGGGIAVRGLDNALPGLLIRLERLQRGEAARARSPAAVSVSVLDQHERRGGGSRPAGMRCPHLHNVAQEGDPAVPHGLKGAGAAGPVVERRHRGGGAHRQRRRRARAALAVTHRRSVARRPASEPHAASATDEAAGAQSPHTVHGAGVGVGLVAPRREGGGRGGPPRPFRRSASMSRRRRRAPFLHSPCAQNQTAPRWIDAASHGGSNGGVGWGRVLVRCGRRPRDDRSRRAATKKSFLGGFRETVTKITF